MSSPPLIAAAVISLITFPTNTPHPHSSPPQPPEGAAAAAPLRGAAVRASRAGAPRPSLCLPSAQLRAQLPGEAAAASGSPHGARPAVPPHREALTWRRGDSAAARAIPVGAVFFVCLVFFSSSPSSSSLSPSRCPPYGAAALPSALAPLTPLPLPAPGRARGLKWRRSHRGSYRQRRVSCRRGRAPRAAFHRRPAHRAGEEK